MFWFLEVRQEEILSRIYSLFSLTSFQQNLAQPASIQWLWETWLWLWITHCLLTIY